MPAASGEGSFPDSLFADPDDCIAPGGRAIDAGYLGGRGRVFRRDADVRGPTIDTSAAGGSASSLAMQ